MPGISFFFNSLKPVTDIPRGAAATHIRTLLHGVPVDQKQRSPRFSYLFNEEAPQGKAGYLSPSRFPFIFLPANNTDTSQYHFSLIQGTNNSSSSFHELPRCFVAISARVSLSL